MRLRLCKGGREAGQVFVVFALALPLLLGFAALVVDLGNAYVQKRTMQQAADAAALAAAQELDPVMRGCLPGCEPAVRISVADRVGQYSADNGGPSPLPACPSASYPDPCYTWPYHGQDGLVEVRLKTAAGGFFGSILGFPVGFLKPKARAVAAATAITAPHCDFTGVTPPVVNPDQYLPSCVIPGTSQPPGTYSPAGSPQCDFTGVTPPVVVVNPDQYLPNCVIPATSPTSGAGFCSDFNPPVVNPDQYFSAGCIGPILGGVDGAVALVRSSACDAITYAGAGANGQALGAFVTNGGLRFQGGGNLKKVKSLAYNEPGCPSDPSAPPSGSSTQCTSTAPGWGDATDSNNSCVRNLIDISGLTPFPRGWSIPPPTVPTPVATTWNASTDYPTRCHDLGSNNNVTFSTATNPPGIYCYTGTGTLTLSSDLSAGDGYTFFTTNGGAISIGSNSKVYKFYWPSGQGALGCGDRPTTTRPASFTCFAGTANERTISGYDPQTLLYSSSTHGASCSTTRSIDIAGGNNTIIGDIFAPSSPNGCVSVTGGAVSAGSGFIETWWMTIAGNFGSYTGTGENIGGQQATGIRHCLFPPGTVFPSGTNADDYLDTTPDRCTIPGSSAVTGNPVPATSEHCAFPSGTVFPPGTSADDYVNTSPVRCTIPPDPPVTGTPTTTVTGVDYGMDE